MSVAIKQQKLLLPLLWPYILGICGTTWGLDVFPHIENLLGLCYKEHEATELWVSLAALPGKAPSTHEIGQAVGI